MKMQAAVAFAATLVLASVHESDAFTIDDPTSDTLWTNYTPQEPLVQGSIVASGGPSELASGNCTFDEGTLLQWTVKKSDATSEDVYGCIDVDHSGTSEDSWLPRSESYPYDTAYNPTAFNSTAQWCYIGTVNDGSDNADNAGLANYNAKVDDNADGKWDEWAYCSMSESVYRYTSVKGFSLVDANMNIAGYPCAGTWNYNNGDDIQVGVTNSCLPFADYPPQTDGLDLSEIPDAWKKYWCFLEPGDESVGYNPNKMDSGSYSDKVYQWGFCQDSEDPYIAVPTAKSSVAPTDSTLSPTQAPAATPSVNPGGTSSPTPGDSKESTESPSTSSPTPDAEPGSNDAPSPATITAFPSVLLALLAGLTMQHFQTC
ncbi:Hypothetical Protein FCC1311_022662 [Hondaea fermentalgiana]|uniref:Uncharacterized protein n=1 Tax=Hondaea fermentalgiana TaxID=2315210 RepID=A0A2R5G4U6_9STRA|nr:Hypothetical Protein FCC1311_022662 [Hondaea fermentalgiana]|eukprot:GBG26046.1 Hypothetical Protein FCC1311_022662 [Hondaea fermentalgiana]